MRLRKSILFLLLLSISFCSDSQVKTWTIGVFSGLDKLIMERVIHLKSEQMLTYLHHTIDSLHKKLATEHNPVLSDLGSPTTGLGDDTGFYYDIYVKDTIITTLTDVKFHYNLQNFQDDFIPHYFNLSDSAAKSLGMVDSLFPGKWLQFYVIRNTSYLLQAKTIKNYRFNGPWIRYQSLFGSYIKQHPPCCGNNYSYDFISFYRNGFLSEMYSFDYKSYTLDGIYIAPSKSPRISTPDIKVKDGRVTKVEYQDTPQYNLSFTEQGKLIGFNFFDAW